jgi:serine/threonine protein kinase/formylglycine-generating enzyme required for sulfatase activity
MEAGSRVTISDDKSRSPLPRELLHAALDLPAEERQASVEAHLPPGETLDDALSLLAEMDDLGEFLEKSPTLPPPIPFEPVLPERVGSYRVERVLGWGSMGVVYLATQEAPQRPVAVKVLRVDASSPTLAKRFAQEGSVLARLSHPGIASVYESGVSDLGTGQQPYLAMEYIDGVSITRYVKEQALDRRGRVELIVHIARAVAHAHEHGVLHRDLKPENILVRPDGTPVVLDFGVAQATSDDVDHLTLTATGQVIGTLAYMAPEQARGAKLDARADQFGLGAILFEMLTGELPFDVRGRLPHEALRIIADGDCRLPTRQDPTLTGDIEAILMTVLAPEPVRRYTDVDAFADDLQRWLDGEPVIARPPSKFESLQRFVRRNRALTAVVVLGLLATGAGISWATGALFDLRREGAVSLLFSDRRLLAGLEQEAEGLWPTSRATVPAFDSWLERAGELTERLPQHREAMSALEEAGSTRTASGLEFESAWLLDEGTGLIDALEAFSHGLALEVAARQATSRAIYRSTVEDHRDDWRGVAERVRTDPRFDGLDLPPQEGLIPLGPDPDSGLEEFAVWSSGGVPIRDAGGRFQPREDYALVLVLVPGGDILIGGQQTDAGSASYDLQLKPHEGPPFSTLLAPFLISKYEMTQAQWRRAYGTIPSDWEIGATIKGKTITGLHPVDSISWQEAVQLLPRLALTLPTEAQWERAARGGTTWTFLMGPEWSDLIGHANWNTHRPVISLEELGIADDGYESHMPVGSLLPNRYGLHDVIGNVWELCQDTYKVRYHDLEHRTGDGLVLAEPDGDVSVRGGGSAISPRSARVFARRDILQAGRDAETGVRPARVLVLEEAPEPRSTSPSSND